MSLPLVSAIVPAHDYGRFVGRALESALGQDYPPDRLEVVVVDDGSTDDTHEVVQEVARRHPGRVRHLHQHNQGFAAATSRALAEARGELLAFLDADDRWPADKTLRQVELLAARPEVGLVYCDMEIIDPQDRLLHASLWERFGQVPVRGPGTLGLLLGTRGNMIATSSIMVRAGLLERFAPIPPTVPYVDYWLAARVARVAALDHVEGLRVGYRLHGDNMLLGAEGARAVREHLKRAEARRRVLATGDGASLPVEQLLDAWQAMEDAGHAAVRTAGTAFVSPVPATQAETTAARDVAAAAQAAERAGHLEEALALRVQAGALDPFDLDGRQAMRALARALRTRAADATPELLRGARRFVTLAFADELLADPELLAAYGAAFGPADDATLAIAAPGMAAATVAERLGPLVARSGLDGADAPDLLALPLPGDGLALDGVARAAHAALTSRPDGLGLHRFGAGEVPRLRERALAHLAAA